MKLDEEEDSSLGTMATRYTMDMQANTQDNPNYVGQNALLSELYQGSSAGRAQYT